MAECGAIFKFAAPHSRCVVSMSGLMPLSFAGVVLIFKLGILHFLNVYKKRVNVFTVRHFILAILKVKA